MDTVRVQIVKFDPFLYKKDEYIKIVNDLDDDLPIEFSVLFSSGYKPLTDRTWTKEKIIEFIDTYISVFHRMSLNGGVKVDYVP